MPKVTEEQKKFISEQYLTHGKGAADTIKAFEEKYGHSPSTRVFNRWKHFNESDGDGDTGKEEKTGKEGDLDVETDDTRTDKGSKIDFSSGDVPDEQFNKLCKTFGISQREMWDTLVKASNRGYTKVDPVSGEFSK